MKALHWRFLYAILWISSNCCLILLSYIEYIKLLVIEVDLPLNFKPANSITSITNLMGWWILLSNADGYAHLIHKHINLLVKHIALFIGPIYQAANHLWKCLGHMLMSLRSSIVLTVYSLLSIGSLNSIWGKSWLSFSQFHWLICKKQLGFSLDYYQYIWKQSWMRTILCNEQPTVCNFSRAVPRFFLHPAFVFMLSRRTEYLHCLILLTH